MEQLELDLRTDAEIAEDEKVEKLKDCMAAWKHKLDTDPVYREEFQEKTCASLLRIREEQRKADELYNRQQREWWAANKDRPITM